MNTKQVILLIFLAIVLVFSLYEILYAFDKHLGPVLIIFFGFLAAGDVAAISAFYFSYLKNHQETKE
jgi:hypothetical protein